MSNGLAAFAILAWLAYLASRVLARRNLPELVGFLVVGAVLGPSALGLISAEELSRLEPVTEIALGVLMFVIGERVSGRALRAARWSVTTGLAQFVLSGLGVYAASQALGADRSVSLLLASLAGAGAPMTIAHVVATSGADGPYAKGLVSTHAVSDALATATFAAVLPVATLLSDDTADVAGAVFDFVKLGLGGIAVGVVGGFLIARLGHQIETSGELLLFVGVHMMLGWAVSTTLDLSFPLAALVAGSVASSISPVPFAQRLFRTLRSIEQPLYLLFFALAGASIHLSDLVQVGELGAAYIGVRVLAKLAGAVIGGPLGGLGFRQSLLLGLDLTPQAGVAVGLAVVAGETIPEQGGEAATVVLGAVVLFELIGPLLVSRHLARGPASDIDDGDSLGRVLDLDHVPARILVASPSIIDIPEWVIDTAGWWKADVVLLMPGEDDSPQVELAERRADKVATDLDFKRLTSESFTGAVVREAQAMKADLLVLFAHRALGTSTRLVLFPHERIARQLDCPVLEFPLPEAGPPGG